MTSLLTGKLWAGGFQDPKTASALELLGDEGESQGRGCFRVGQRAVTETCHPLALRYTASSSWVMLRNGSIKPPNTWSI